MFRVSIYVVLILHIVLVTQISLRVAAFSLRQNDLTSENNESGRTHVHTTPASKPLLPPEDGGMSHHDMPPISGLLRKCAPCPDTVLCVPQIQCPAHVRMHDHEKPQICDLPGDKFGYCCTSGQNHTVSNQNKARRSTLPLILPVDVLEEARKNFKHLMQDIAQIPVHPGQPDFTHGIMFHSTPQEDLHQQQLSNNALQQVITSQVFSKKEHVPVDDFITNNVHVKFTKTPLGRHCGPPPICRNINDTYRSFDGTCNNPLPHRSLWGAAGQPMERLLPPAYEDGIWMPRMHSTDGSHLVSAREVSRALLSDIDRPHSKYNLLLMQFGQLLAHDISQTASVRLENGELVQCCTPGGLSHLPPHQTHFACMPISVSPDDEFYGSFGVRCLNFVRLGLVPSPDCQLSYGKQRSKVTHFVDASPVYGSNEQMAQSLRTFHGGRLSMFDDFGRQLLPLTRDRKACDSDEPGKTCFKSGDGRTNQIVSLITLHILLAREHNRVADALAILNPSASDEWLFQEARRIVIAEMQHITYNEYLPAIIGPMAMKRFRLVPQHHGYAQGYNIDINPAITNEFSGAAFRMGHSTVDGKFRIHRSQKSNIDEVINIPDVMFNPSRMRKQEFYDDMLRTLYTQPMQSVDSFITQGLSRFLFHGHSPFGLDLAAINIQRGRDQGLRSYNDYLEVMGQRKLQSFGQLPSEVGAKLARVYHTTDDIDLWVGGLLEKPVENGCVGNTFAEIIADQFARFKQGDRYFYEYNSTVNPGAFNLTQLHELRKVTMARLVCDNADHLTLNSVPLAAFVRPDFAGNSMIRCDDPNLPVVNLNAWRV
ncbi:chorion peroxidase [Scaptodrosophila lebanonensis]|uniref:Chorion peroxidase n=1 Tax=Drosophila lebanonensis TaxID=7225 RepID=A0A6J2TL79_DROLE|nr:chorion peroxidase [Scaptodrosophila lebanonensis]